MADTDQRVGRPRIWSSLGGVLIACLVIVACAVFAAGFGVHLARAADHIHDCNAFDLEPCESAFTFPFRLLQGIGIAAGLVLVASAFWLAALRVRRGGRSRTGVAFSAALALVGVCSAALIAHSAAQGRAIYPYGDPSHWMNVGVALLATQVAFLLVVVETAIRGSLGVAAQGRVTRGRAGTY